MGDPEPNLPTQEEMASAQMAFDTGTSAIGEAATKDAAQDAYDEALMNEHLTEEQKASLMVALNARNTMLDNMASAQMAFDTGTSAIGEATTKEAAQAAYDEALMNEYLTEEQKADLMVALNARNTMLDNMASAQMAFDTGTSAIGEATTKEAAQAAYDEALMNEYLTEEQKADLMLALDDLNTMLDVEDAIAKIKAAETKEAAIMAYNEVKDNPNLSGDQMNELVDELLARVEEIDDETQTAYLNAINELEGATTKEAAEMAYNAVKDNPNLSDEQKAELKDEFDKKNDMLDMEIMQMARRLYEGIDTDSLPREGGELRQAGYDEDGLDNDPNTAADNNAFTITFDLDDNGTADEEQVLTEDEDTMIDPLESWEGKKYTAETDDNGTYEAYVYSNTAPTEGQRFGNPEAAQVGTAEDQFKYQLDTRPINEVNTALTIQGVDGTTAPSTRVSGPSFPTVGGKNFKDEDVDRNLVMVAGSYDGVPGTYRCSSEGAIECRAEKAETGFILGTVDDGTFTAGSGWTFQPTDPDARVIAADPDNFATYGWWLHKSEDGNTFTVSAFADERGTVPDASGITVLRGIATYSGGAAGQYALYSAVTNGTNDAGHFRAKATLQADFDDDTITGTIDDFIGADGESLLWSVELNESRISDVGLIVGEPDTTNTDWQETVWTIGDTAADAAGGWNGTLYDNHEVSDVPQIGTGTFYSEYDNVGRMVGAFGVNLDD